MRASHFAGGGQKLRESAKSLSSRLAVRRSSFSGEKLIHQKSRDDLVSGRQPTDDLSLQPGLFRSLAHPAFQSIHDQSCQSLTSDGKVRPCFMMMITQTKYVSRW